MAFLVCSASDISEWRLHRKMNVLAFFQSDYAGELSGAVWITDTPKNIIRFEEDADLESNRALFLAESYKTSEAAIWGIQDHYPIGRQFR